MRAVAAALILLLAGCAAPGDGSELPSFDWKSWGEQSAVLRLTWRISCQADCRPSLSIGQRMTLPHARRNDLQLLHFPED